MGKSNFKVSLYFDAEGLTNYICGFANELMDIYPDAGSAYIMDRCKEELTQVLDSYCKVGSESCLTEEEEDILSRISHLDATHVGTDGNPYFYVCLNGLDYCLNDSKWDLCEWSDRGSELDDPKQFTPIKFGEQD